jgi:hypothetical protein
LKIIEDVRAGRVKVDREIDELTMALKNPEHLGRCRGFGVVPWKFGFRGDIATYRSRRRRREREEEEWRQELETRLKEHEEKLTADIEWRVAADVNDMALAQGRPLVQVPSAHKKQLCFHGGSRRAKGNRRSSSGQPTVPGTLWMTSVGAPDVSFTSHSATSK